MIVRNSIHMRIARRAVELSGGLVPLARYLNVHPRLLGDWIDGRQDIPADLLLKLMDIALGPETGPRPGGARPIREVDSFRHREAANG